jgi:transposase
MDSLRDIQVLKDLVSNLLSRVSSLEEENALLRSENTQLKLENDSLRNQLKQNSNNSHKPPSTDGLKKKPALAQSKGNPKNGF